MYCDREYALENTVGVLVGGPQLYRSLAEEAIIIYYTSLGYNVQGPYGRAP
jgi:hypothetical protein